MGCRDFVGKGVRNPTPDNQRVARGGIENQTNLADNRPDHTITSDKRIFTISKNILALVPCVCYTIHMNRLFNNITAVDMLILVVAAYCCLC